MKNEPGSVINAFTVDVEDYFHTEVMSSVVSHDEWRGMSSRVEANTHRLLDLLDGRGVRATFFVLGWVAARYPKIVREIATRGHELGCHTMTHQAVFRTRPEQFREGTLSAKRSIEDASGFPVLGYRAASFSMVRGTQWALDTLAELGFVYDSSVNPIAHPFYGNRQAPRTPHVMPCGIWELPIATVRMGGLNVPIGGGAYLRLFPYDVMRVGWKWLNESERQRGIFYVHPWELDPAQPRLRAKWSSRLRQYTNLSTTEGKLQRLLGDFRFGPIIDVFEAELTSSAVSTAVSKLAFVAGN